MYIGLGISFYKQKTAYEMRIRDWSSDVCSSDLLASHEPRITRITESEARFILQRACAHGETAAGQWEQDNGDGRNRHRWRNAAHDRGDRKTGVQGTSESVRVDLGGSRLVKKKI